MDNIDLGNQRVWNRSLSTFFHWEKKCWEVWGWCTVPQHFLNVSPYNENNNEANEFNLIITFNQKQTSNNNVKKKWYIHKALTDGASR